MAPACWHCGATLRDVPLPLGLRSECPACHAELHVCRMCRHYDTSKAKHCREPMAEEVRNKKRANFCEWFQTGDPAPTLPPADTKGAAKNAAALFGDGAPVSPSTPEDARLALKDLFGK